MEGGEEKVAQHNPSGPESCVICQVTHQHQEKAAMGGCNLLQQMSKPVPYFWSLPPTNLCLTSRVTFQITSMRSLSYGGSFHCSPET